MRGRTSIQVLLLSALLPAAASAASITVWDGSSFRGSSTVIDGSVRNLSDYGWNDRISSLRVDSGQWEFCREPDFRACHTIVADEVAADAFATLDSTWNNAISSVRPLSATTVETQPVKQPDTHQQVAQRVYRALLGRDADPGGLRTATNDVARGQLESVVRGMAQSPEYRRLRQQRSASELLDQIYRAILDRPADATARRAYLAAMERGDAAQVVLDLLASDEYRVGESTTADDEDLSLKAEGDGLVVWGGNGKYETLSGVTATLERGGKARIDLTGATNQTLIGTWTREGDDMLSVKIPDVAGRRVNANVRLQLDGEKLARFEMIGGGVGARSSAVMSFVADGYELPPEEMLCHQQARAQLEDERGAPMVMLFLQPERSRISSSRDELTGDALTLADPARFTYTCEIDSRRGQVLDASIRRR